MDREVTVAASGDSFITQHMECCDGKREKVAGIIRKADIRVANLETTLGEGNCPNAVSGGTWASSSPLVMEDMMEYGFNFYAIANNHTLDYGYEGLDSTESCLRELGLQYAGAGQTLDEASAPCYLTLPDCRAALISTTATFHESWTAGARKKDCRGRPGINPLRYRTTYNVSRDELGFLVGLADRCGINMERDLRVREGFTLRGSDEGDNISGYDEGKVFVFGEHRFRSSAIPGEETVPLEKDMERISATIREAGKMADMVLVSVHSHEMKGGSKDRPADFLVNFARNCIDNGAHAVIGHGPHVLRGLEIYRKRPIFYSLGNFIFQNDTVSVLPSDFYEKYEVDIGSSVADALDARSLNGQRGLGVNPHVWESLIPLMTFSGGELQDIRLYPISLGFADPVYKRGWPRLSGDALLLKRFSDLSSEFGTQIVIDKEKGEGRVLVP